MTSVMFQHWMQSICLSHALQGTTFEHFLVCGPTELQMVKRQLELNIKKDLPYILLMGEHAAHFHTADTGNRTLNTLQAYLNTKGISCKVANEHTPRIKSAAVQTACRLLETPKTMLTDADWISRHWGDVLQHATYTLNWAPMPLVASDSTPHEMFTKSKQSVQNALSTQVLSTRGHTKCQPPWR